MGVDQNAIKEMLRPGGQIMVDNPRFDSFSLDLMKQTPDCPVRNAVPSTRSIFTKKSLQRFLVAGGFEVILDWRYGLDFYNFIHTISLKVPELVRQCAIPIPIRTFRRVPAHLRPARLQRWPILHRPTEGRLRLASSRITRDGEPGMSRLALLGGTPVIGSDLPSNHVDVFVTCVLQVLRVLLP